MARPLERGAGLVQFSKNMTDNEALNALAGTQKLQDNECLNFLAQAEGSSAPDFTGCNVIYVSKGGAATDDRGEEPNQLSPYDYTRPFATIAAAYGAGEGVLIIVLPGDYTADVGFGSNVLLLPGAVATYEQMSSGSNVISLGDSQTAVQLFGKINGIQWEEEEGVGFQLNSGGLVQYQGDNVLELLCNTDGISTVSSGGNGGSRALRLIGSAVQVPGGQFTLVAGSAAVADARISANSNVGLTVSIVGGTRDDNPDVVLEPGVGFTATGAATDTSTYNYTILEPSF
jgi:hypothetical protein